MKRVIVFFVHLFLVVTNRLRHPLNEYSPTLLTHHSLSTSDRKVTAVISSRKRSIKSDRDGFTAGAGHNGIYNIALLIIDFCVLAILSELLLGKRLDTNRLRREGRELNDAVAAIYTQDLTDGTKLVGGIILSVFFDVMLETIVSYAVGLIIFRKHLSKQLHRI